MKERQNKSAQKAAFREQLRCHCKAPSLVTRIRRRIQSEFEDFREKEKDFISPI